MMISVLTVISCSVSDYKSLDGIWKITDIEFSQEHEDIGLKNILANAVAPNGFKPEVIEVKGKTLILKAKNGERNELDFKILESNDKSFTLTTDKGNAIFNIIDADSAKFTIAGATYNLKR